jgi:hypothetical protein
MIINLDSSEDETPVQTAPRRKTTIPTRKAPVPVEYDEISDDDFFDRSNYGKNRETPAETPAEIPVENVRPANVLVTAPTRRSARRNSSEKSMYESSESDSEPIVKPISQAKSRLIEQLTSSEDSDDDRPKKKPKIDRLAEFEKELMEEFNVSRQVHERLRKEKEAVRQLFVEDDFEEDISPLDEELKKAEAHLGSIAQIRTHDPETPVKLEVVAAMDAPTMQSFIDSVNRPIPHNLKKFKVQLGQTLEVYLHGISQQVGIPAVHLAFITLPIKSNVSRLFPDTTIETIARLTDAFKNDSVPRLCTFWKTRGG